MHLSPANIPYLIITKGLTEFYGVGQPLDVTLFFSEVLTDVDVLESCAHPQKGVASSKDFQSLGCQAWPEGCASVISW